MGWFWYVGTLVPVIGLVQVGLQAHADRYMYVPMIGLSVILAWGAADVFTKWPRTKMAIATTGIVFCAACMVIARMETAYWQNSGTLFQRAIHVTQGNVVAEYNLGTYLGLMQRNAEAIPHFEAALRLKPDYAEAQHNLGVSLLRSGYCPEAIPHFQAAIRFKPDYASAYDNLGDCEMRGGDYPAAVANFEAAVRAAPDTIAAYFKLGMAVAMIPSRAQDALQQYEATLKSKPNDVATQLSLGGLLAGLGRNAEAIPHLAAAQRLRSDPKIAKALNLLLAGQR
jgi:tetratricopeptide (TPR) repeat protein